MRWRHGDAGGEVAADAHLISWGMGCLRRPSMGGLRKSCVQGMGGERERERERARKWRLVGAREIFPGGTIASEVRHAGREKEGEGEVEGASRWMGDTWTANEGKERARA